MIEDAKIARLEKELAHLDKVANRTEFVDVAGRHHAFHDQLVKGGFYVDAKLPLNYQAGGLISSFVFVVSQDGVTHLMTQSALEDLGWFHDPFDAELDAIPELANLAQVDAPLDPVEVKALWQLDIQA